MSKPTSEEGSYHMCSATLNGKNFQKISVTWQLDRPLHYVTGQF